MSDSWFAQAPEILVQDLIGLLMCLSGGLATLVIIFHKNTGTADLCTSHQKESLQNYVGIQTPPVSTKTAWWQCTCEKPLNKLNESSWIISVWPCYQDATVGSKGLTSARRGRRAGTHRNVIYIYSVLSAPDWLVSFLTCPPEVISLRLS